VLWKKCVRNKVPQFSLRFLFEKCFVSINNYGVTSVIKLEKVKFHEYQNSCESWYIRTVGCIERRTDGQTDMTKLIGWVMQVLFAIALRNEAKHETISKTVSVGKIESQPCLHLSSKVYLYLEFCRSQSSNPYSFK
jgi:hypothetical protein